MKVSKIKHSYIEGYELGGYYLIKVYGINTYWWVLSKEKRYYGGYEGTLEERKGNIKYIASCKKGKELLVKLFNKEITFEEVK